jgi:hypothetical protein
MGQLPALRSQPAPRPESRGAGSSVVSRWLAWPATGAMQMVTSPGNSGTEPKTNSTFVRYRHCLLRTLRCIDSQPAFLSRDRRRCTPHIPHDRPRQVSGSLGRLSRPYRANRRNPMPCDGAAVAKCRHGACNSRASPSRAQVSGACALARGRPASVMKLIPQRGCKRASFQGVLSKDFWSATPRTASKVLAGSARRRDGRPSPRLIAASCLVAA